MLGNPANFVDGNPENAVKDGSLLGLVYKGGIVVPVIITLLFTVIALSIERWLALRTAFGKGKLPKFVTNIKAALKANDFAKAQKLCDEQKGSVANVIGATLATYTQPLFYSLFLPSFHLNCTPFFTHGTFQVTELNLSTITTEAHSLEPRFCNKRNHCNEKPPHLT